MNIRRKARALASSLLILAGLSGAANAQYHVDEVRPHALPTLRSIPTHVPGSSHNLYGPDTVADAIEPVPPTIVSPIEDRRPQPAPAGLVASPARQRELLDEIKAKRNQANAAAPPAPAPGITAIQRRHAQIARRMAYNDRVVTRAEQESNYIQANMWWNLSQQPEDSPWHLLMNSATMYGYHGYGYGTQDRVYPVYGLGGPGCVPMSGY